MKNSTTFLSLLRKVGLLIISLILAIVISYKNEQVPATAASGLIQLQSVQVSQQAVASWPIVLHAVIGSDGTDLYVSTGQTPNICKGGMEFKVSGSSARGDYVNGSYIAFLQNVFPFGTNLQATNLEAHCKLANGDQLVAGPIQVRRYYASTNSSTSILSKDNNAELSIFPTSLNTSHYITVMTTNKLPGLLPGGVRLVGQPYSFRASGGTTSSDQNMNLNLFYSPLTLSNADPLTLRIFHWNESSKNWVDDGNQNILINNHISKATKKFTTYALGSTGQWYDDFVTSVGLDYSTSNNINRILAGGGKLKLDSTSLPGTAMSKPYTPTLNIASWQSISYTANIATGASITVNVLSVDQTVLMSNVTPGQSLNGINPADHPSLRLQVEMATTSGESPELLDWSIVAEPIYWAANVVDQTSSPVADAIVYRGGRLITSTLDIPYFTDQSGAVPLANQPGLISLDAPIPGQPLVALYQTHEQTTTRAAHEGWAYRTYITSLHLDNQGNPQPDTIESWGRQQVTVRQDDPLILFNLVVSVEWNAGAAYLSMLEDAFRKASAYLYDVTDGQMAFGQVTIYDNAEFWADADFQISARNTVRPYAFVGGITSDQSDQAIRVGRFWNGNSGNEGNWNEPFGYRTLIHQFGHYALYLHDEYFLRVYDSNGKLIREVPAACTNQDKVGPPATPDRDRPENASIMYFQYNASELADRDRWNQDCQNTEQHRLNGKSDWETVVEHYSGSGWTLNTPTSRGSVMAGPEQFPTNLLPFPEITIHNGGHTGVTPRQLTVLDGQGQPVQNALVALYTAPFSNSVAVDQGLTDAQGRITVYGAAPGDIIKAATFDGAYVGTVLVTDQTTYQLTLVPTTDQSPVLSVVPYSDGQSLALTVYGLPPGGSPLTALVTPSGGSSLPPVLLKPSGGAYTGLVTGVPLGSGQIQISGLDLSTTLISDYNLQAIQVATATILYSRDGNFELHLPSRGIPADGYSTVLPTGYVPGPLPAGKQVIGSAYEVRLSGALVALEKEGLVRLHYHPEVMGVYTDMLIYYWEAGEKKWQPLGGEPSEVDNALSIPTKRLGIYALMGVQAANNIDQDTLYLPLIVK